MRAAPTVTTLVVLLISGCGGSNSDHSVTVGGTVSGLTGKLVLQDNGGDNLTLSANGAFTFGTRLGTGGNYAVSILTQPPGPTCTVANGSGTATADVANVMVTCTTDPATVFLPIAATPKEGVTDPKASGLYVVSSKSPGDPPIQVTSQPVGSLGLQNQYALDAQGKVSARQPYQLLYTTINSTGDNHVWSLDLTGNSSLVPKQVSSLNIPYHTEIAGNGDPAALLYCTGRVIAKKLNDPSSAFLFVSLPNATDQSCPFDQSTLKWYSIHAGDGPTTAPVALPGLQSGILPLYRPDGSLSGLVAVDGAHNLNFYPDETLANPRLLVANVESFSALQDYGIAPGHGVATDPTSSYLYVQYINGPTKKSLYRIDQSGTLSAELYQFAVYGGLDGWALDSGTLYFGSQVTGNVNTQDRFLVRVADDGQPAQTLTDVSGTFTDPMPNFAGVSGSNIWAYIATQPVTSWLVQTAPANTPGTLTTVSSDAGVPSLAFFGGDVFVSFTRFSADFSTQQSLTQILDSTGNVLQALQPNSNFLRFDTTVLQLSGVTDPRGYGGGTLSAFNQSQPLSTPPVSLKTPTGSAFTFQNTTQLDSGAQVSPTILALTTVLRPDAQNRNPGPTLVVDLAKGTVASVSLPNSFAQLLLYDETRGGL